MADELPPGFQSFPNMRKLLVFAPHVDDQTVGNPLSEIAGRQGGKVHVLVLNVAPFASERVTRLGEQQDWTAVVNARYAKQNAIFTFSTPEISLEQKKEKENGKPVVKHRIQTSRANVASLIRELKEFNPTDITVPTETDAHPDHIASNKLVMGALKRYTRTTGRTIRVWMTTFWGHPEDVTHAVMYDEGLMQERLAHMGTFPSQEEQVEFSRAIHGAGVYHFGRVVERILGFGSHHPFNRHKKIKYADLLNRVDVGPWGVRKVNPRIYLAPLTMTRRRR